MKVLFVVIYLFSVLSFAGENPFLRFTPEALSSTETFFSQKNILVAPAGNGLMTDIPDFPAFTKYFRMLAGGHGIAFNQQGRNQIAQELAQKSIPEIMRKLDREGLLQEAVRLARIFKMDPLHLLGPIIGENSFNGEIDRTIQDSYHKMFQQSDIELMSSRMAEMTKEPEVKNCLDSNISNYWKWRCVIFYSSRTSNNTNSDLLKGFYSISGKNLGSFGLGQMQPFIIWSLNDIVVSKTKYEKFEITNAEKPMRIIFNNKEMLAYIAASAVVSIQVYKLIAGVDISQNPGLTTTLYNVGDEYKRAFNFANLRKNSNSEVFPEVNYMGWYINKNSKQIRSYLNQYLDQKTKKDYAYEN